MQAAIVETLMLKGRFEPAVALAIAEAMDKTIQNADLVTVAILESRFEKADATLAARFAEVNAHFGEVNARFGEINTRFAGIEGQLQLLREEMKRRNLQYILCTAAIVGGNDHLDAIGGLIANAFRALLT